MQHPNSHYNYPLRVRVVFLGVLFTLAATLKLFPRFEAGDPANLAAAIDEFVRDIDIPETRQFEPPPPPPRPSIPIESEAEDLAEDITIEETSLDNFEDWKAPPMPDNDAGSRIKFIAYDEPPAPIGGYAAIANRLVYPEIARQAGIQGTVVLQIFVNERGFITEVLVQKGLPQTGLDEAAVKAIKQVRFTPARQRDRPLGVWISIPIQFRLSS